jgi:hypothetical protein
MCSIASRACFGGTSSSEVAAKVRLIPFWLSRAFVVNHFTSTLQDAYLRYLGNLEAIWGLLHY